MNTYAAEEFTSSEADILRRYFTNLDQPVFALVNLPEVVKGALFARYSRSHKSLRRLFLDEFVTDLDITGDVTIDATVGLERAEQLYEKVFVEYGDDSVAQLGGVHLACEQASNLLTKVLEWGRLMSYLEQSTRYIAYDRRLEGRYRYYRDPDVLASPLGTRYVGDLDRMFDTYAELVTEMVKFLREVVPQGPEDSDFVYRQAIQARAFDSVRGVLPGASMSNVGIFGTGQSYEYLLLRMRSHPLPEARRYAALMLTELRKVIPSFLRRVDQVERGQVWSEYLGDRADAMAEIADRLLGVTTPADSVAPVTLTSFDPDAEISLITAMLYPFSHLPETQIRAQVEKMSAAERVAVVDAYVGERANRRHKPGRALERIDYRFDVLADYGAFRDLQRHRMLTVEWQPLSPRHGYTRPEAVDAAGLAGRFDDAMERSASLYTALEKPFPAQAAYAVALAYRVRFVMQLNAREAMHLIELRTTPQGHPAYRRVAQHMYELIADEAGHPAVAALMRHVDLSDDPPLGRLEAERRAEKRRHPVA
ncbi:MAG TPA: FAD-dependent thymidylate synthase [Acidimicrobiales bacterium]|nr:FAD-dependent thymidylate synthase [Acidimicrobiales bacterium]